MQVPRGFCSSFHNPFLTSSRPFTQASSLTTGLGIDTTSARQPRVPTQHCSGMSRVYAGRRRLHAVCAPESRALASGCTCLRSTTHVATDLKQAHLCGEEHQRICPNGCNGPRDLEARAVLAIAGFRQKEAAKTGLIELLSMRFAWRQPWPMNVGIACSGRWQNRGHTGLEQPLGRGRSITTRQHDKAYGMAYGNATAASRYLGSRRLSSPARPAAHLDEARQLSVLRVLELSEACTAAQRQRHGPLSGWSRSQLCGPMRMPMLAMLQDAETLRWEMFLAKAAGSRAIDGAAEQCTATLSEETGARASRPVRRTARLARRLPPPGCAQCPAGPASPAQPCPIRGAAATAPLVLVAPASNQHCLQLCTQGKGYETTQLRPHNHRQRLFHFWQLDLLPPEAATTTSPSSPPPPLLVLP